MYTYIYIHMCLSIHLYYIYIYTYSSGPNGGIIRILGPSRSLKGVYRGHYIVHILRSQKKSFAQAMLIIPYYQITQSLHHIGTSSTLREYFSWPRAYGTQLMVDVVLIKLQSQADLLQLCQTRTRLGRLARAGTQPSEHSEVLREFYALWVGP